MCSDDLTHVFYASYGDYNKCRIERWGMGKRLLQANSGSIFLNHRCAVHGRYWAYLGAGSTHVFYTTWPYHITPRNMTTNISDFHIDLLFPCFVQYTGE